MGKISLIVVFLFGMNSLIEKQEVITIEGFYSSGWEKSILYEIREDKVFKPDWIKFSKEYVISDSIQKILDKASNLDNFYMKARAIKRIDGNFGHLSAFDREFEVLKIIDIDTTFQLKNFLKKKK